MSTVCGEDTVPPCPFCGFESAICAARTKEIQRPWRERTQEAEARVAELENKIRMYIPYVLASLPISAHVRMSKVTTSDPEWTAVHLGRALSSRAQLQNLLNFANEYSNRPKEVKDEGADEIGNYQAGEGDSRVASSHHGRSPHSGDGSATEGHSMGVRGSVLEGSYGPGTSGLPMGGDPGTPNRSKSAADVGPFVKPLHELVPYGECKCECSDCIQGEHCHNGYCKKEHTTRRTRRKAKPKPAATGHEEPCAFCAKPCDVFAADPGKWPVGLTHPDHTGILRWHHHKCVEERLFKESKQ